MARIIGASTLRFDLSRGTLSFVLATLIDEGSLNTAPVMSYDPQVQELFMSPNGTLDLADSASAIGNEASAHRDRKVE